MPFRFSYKQPHRILDLCLKLRNFTTIVLFLFFVPSFFCIFHVPHALSVEISSSILNFSFTKSAKMLSLFSHVSSWNPAKMRLFRGLQSSKLASFFFVLEKKSSVVSSSLISSTPLSISSSLLLTSSIWYWTLSSKSVNSFLIFEFLVDLIYTRKNVMDSQFKSSFQNQK